MRTIYPILLIVILFISWVNWRLLIKWFPYCSSRVIGYGYWLVTLASWLMIGYSWVLKPETPFFYEWITPLVNLSFIWVLSEIFLLLLFPLFFPLRRVAQRVDPSRRNFLQTVLFAAPMLSIGTSISGVYSAEEEMVVRRYTLPLATIPDDLRGFKIAQISDTHLGSFFTLDRLDQVIQLVIQEAPDIVVITGDFIDDLALLESAVAKISQLSSLIPYGIYFCWGNHEHFHDFSRIRRELLKSPIHLLENSNTPVKVKGATLYLLGVDYLWPIKNSEKDNIRRQFMMEAEKNIPDGAFKILLAHHPDFLFNGFASQIPLTLAGHSHGGQVNLAGKLLLPYKYHYMRGLYQEKNVYGYVNSGAGQWLPFRVGCPPEISVFTLSK